MSRSWPSGVRCGSTPASMPTGPCRWSTGCLTSAHARARTCRRWPHADRRPWRRWPWPRRFADAWHPFASLPVVPEWKSIVTRAARWLIADLD